MQFRYRTKTLNKNFPSPAGKIKAYLNYFEDLFRRVRAVTEPAGRLHQCGLPRSIGDKGCGQLSVLSANLWHDWPRFRRLKERLEDFARLVEQEQVDVVLLQEVAHVKNFHADEWLAHRLGMVSVYSRANGHEAIGFEEGLAVLSRFPLGQAYLRQFDSRLNPFARRLALGVPIETPCGRLMAFSVHLGLLRRTNARQVKSLVNWIASVVGGDSALVGGDFNAHETSRQIKHARQHWLDTFRHLHPHSDGTTHTLVWPWGGAIRRQRLDYIFFHSGSLNGEVRETHHLDAPNGPHSDHRAVLTRLDFSNLSIA